MKRCNLVLAFIAIVGLLAVGFQSSSPVSATDRTRPTKLKWGVLLRTKRPFYQEGEVAKVLYIIHNFSNMDAYGLSKNSSGNGCEYIITIRDDAGRKVWEPGAVENGVFVPVECEGPTVPKTLQRNDYLSSAELIPLIFQNRKGNGVLGDPLPAGYYSVCIEVQFNGPHSDPDDPSEHGENFLSCVPIRIEPAN